MTRIFIFLVLGTLVVRGAPTINEAEEEDNITISLESRVQTDMSHTNVICFFQSYKILYKMIKGVEVPESQHEQFAGQVQSDRDALRGGRVTLHLFRVTAEDSGNYSCDLTADYDDSLERRELLTSEHFVVNVTRTSHRPSSNEFIHTSQQATASGEKLKPACSQHQRAVCPNPSKVGPVLAVVALTLLFVSIKYPLLPALLRPLTCTCTSTSVV